MKSSNKFDVAVIGAGVFGAWSALELRKAGLRVLLLDAYGPGNSRSSSGDESRIIRMSYGDAAVYTRFAQRSLPKWIALSKQHRDPLFHATGVLFTALPSTPHLQRSRTTLKKAGMRFDYLDNATLRTRYPQMAFPEGSVGLFEPESGALMARRAVRAVVAEAQKRGVVYRQEPASVPASLKTLDAGQFVFACGAWLPRVFPGLMKPLIHPTRQEVYFFGVPSGSDQFSPHSMPPWVDFGQGVYSFPDLEARGVKFAVDRHGPEFDPEAGSRHLSLKSICEAREAVARYFPGLAGAPLLETRVCQYENSNNGDFLIDRHPEMRNVWIAGGGSGHGFKHGPAVGEYVSGIVTGTRKPEPRFLFKAQPATWERSIY
jgi:sarcosine oxidase